MSTPALRGQPHNPLDCSVIGLEAEDLATDDAAFTDALERAMQRESVDRLERLYPELIFTRHLGGSGGAGKPKGADYAVRQARGQWVAARWRTLP